MKKLVSIFGLAIALMTTTVGLNANCDNGGNIGSHEFGTCVQGPPTYQWTYIKINGTYIWFLEDVEGEFSCDLNTVGQTCSVPLAPF
jgi:hypothetical protein